MKITRRRVATRKKSNRRGRTPRGFGGCLRVSRLTSAVLFDSHTGSIRPKGSASGRPLPATTVNGQKGPTCTRDATLDTSRAGEHSDAAQCGLRPGRRTERRETYGRAVHKMAFMPPPLRIGSWRGGHANRQMRSKNGRRNGNGSYVLKAPVPPLLSPYIPPTTQPREYSRIAVSV